MKKTGTFRTMPTRLLEDWNEARTGYLDLSSGARFIYLTLRISPSNNMANIYVFYPETVAKQSGLTVEEISIAMKELEAKGWIKRQKTVIWLIHGIEEEGNITVDYDKHQKGILRILGALPNIAIINEFCQKHGLDNPHPPIAHNKPMDSLSIGGDKAYANKEQEQEQEQDKKRTESKDSEHKALGIKIKQRKKSTVKSIGEIIAPSNKPEYGTFGYWMGYIRTRYGSKLSKEAYSWAGKLWIEKTGPDDGSDFWKITRQKVELLITFVFDEFIEEDREFSYPVAQKKFSNPTILEDAGRSDKQKARENANAGKLIEGGFGK